MKNNDLKFFVFCLIFFLDVSETSTKSEAGI